MKKSLNTEYFKIYDKSSKDVFYGCSQEWYRNFWQRRAGCGPTTASNLIIYLINSLYKIDYYKDKYNCLLLMEEMWKYVTPTLRGVNTTKILYEGLYYYAIDNNLNVEYKYINIPTELNKRPKIQELIKFISESLDKNLPIAFLNLSNGEEKRLDNWHWVTIISIDAKSETDAEIEIVDDGKIKKIDFALWHSTTILGGGLVSFDLKK